MTVYSHSRVETFKICPFKYWLSYVQNLDTLPSDDPQNALIVGTCMHECIENGVDAGISMYKNSFNCMGNLHYVEIEKFKKLAPQVDNFINRELCEFEYLLENDQFKGYVDCVEHLDAKHVKIYDFKYSNNIENYKKSDQLHLYKKYYEELNVGVKVVELAYIMIPKIQIRQKKTENTINFYHRLDDELEKAEVKKIIVEYDENKTNDFLLDCQVIENTADFGKRESSFCRFCNFYDYCQKGLSCDIISKTK